MTFAPRPRGIRRLATQEQWDFLSQVADSKGIHVNELARRIWDEAVEKLFHIERSRPKRDESVPKMAQKRHKHGQIVSDLRQIYGKLREDYGPEEFEKVFGEQERALEDAVTRADLAALNKIAKDKPWILRKW